MFNQAKIKLAPQVYGVLKKLGWKWTPERGEQFIYWDNIRIVEEVEKGLIENSWIITYCAVDMAIKIRKVESRKCIPILHWERIEEVLEEKGYFWGQMWKCRGFFQVQLQSESRLIADVEGKTRQEAVMKSVIQLGGIDYLLSGRQNK